VFLEQNKVDPKTTFGMVTFCLQHSNFAEKSFQKGIDFGFLYTIPKPNEKKILHRISEHVIIRSITKRWRSGEHMLYIPIYILRM